MKTNNNKVFIAIMGIIASIIFLCFPINSLLIKYEYKELKTTDNWKTYTLTKTSFLGRIEDKIKYLETKIENRTTNYFPLYQTLTKYYYNFIYKTNSLFYKENVPIGLNSTKEYVFYNNDDNFYYLRTNYNEFDLTKKMNKQINFFNNLVKSNDKVTVNILYVPRYEQTTLIDNSLNKYTDIFINSLDNSIKVAKYDINSIEVYKSLFYKTDHHWNIKGAYKGYKIIMNLLNIEPKDNLTYKKVTNKKYYGSFAKSSLSTLSYDDFYDFDYEIKYDVKINNSNPDNKYKPRILNESTNNTFYDYYVKYFNSQYALINYKYGNNKDNLLIFSDSFSWSIDYLIASHYKNTYVINLRNYNNTSIDYNDFIKRNNISQVLFLYEGVSTVFDHYNYGFDKKIVGDC